MKKLLILIFAVTTWTDILAQQLSHIVQRGETFELIARRYNISVNQLMDANPEVDQCFVGYKLNLPEGAKQNTRMVTITDNDIMLAEKASGYIKSGKYRKATTTYSKAIDNNPSSILYFGRGISYYNREKYKSAISDFETAMSRSDCSDEMKSQCERLISNAEKLREEQHERRNKVWGGIAAAVVGAAAVTATAAMANNSSYNAYLPPSKMNGFQRDTSLDYLLDPRLAMVQAQQQEYEEYETFKKLSGANISLDEYRMLKAQANYQNPEKSDNITKDDRTKTDYSKKFETRYSSGKQCVRCLGSGKCQTCLGKGYYYNPLSASDIVICPNCDRNHNGICAHCHGTGKNP